jgi:trk system potassium uptake protein TrkH
MGARSFIPLNLVIAALIIIGGLGFVVNYNILSFSRSKLRRRKKLAVVPKETSLEKLRHFGVHTNIVVITTVILLAAGTFLVYILESSHSFASFSTADKLTASFFQSVTARTAGFNTVDTSALTPATLIIVIILMFIGASPGSTGGGIKTSTFALFVLAAVSRLRNRNRVEVFKRTIPQSVIFNGVVVVVVALSVVLVSTIVLTVTEEGVDFVGMLFEVVSAFGTVGLSTGVTPGLSVAGKITIIITMFVGRIGPLTLMLAMSGQEIVKRYEYPEESVMIG